MESQLGFSLCHFPFELFVLLSLNKPHHQALFVYKIPSLHLCSLYMGILFNSAALRTHPHCKLTTSKQVVVVKFSCLGYSHWLVHCNLRVKK